MIFNDDTESPVSDMVKSMAASVAQNVIFTRREALKYGGSIVETTVLAPVPACQSDNGAVLR
jgi:hypothetical protein